MSFAHLLRGQSETFNAKKNNVSSYSEKELTDVLLQATMVCESAASRGSYRCRFVPYLENRVIHPDSPEFIARLKADGIKATRTDDAYSLDWSVDEPEHDYSHVPHVAPREREQPAAPAPPLGTNSDDDVDDKQPPNKE